MNNNEIKSIIKNGNLLLLKSDKNEFFWYYNEYKILIPYEQDAKLLFPGINESINMEIEISIANKAAVTEVEKILKTLEDGNVL